MSNDQNDRKDSNAPYNGVQDIADGKAKAVSTSDYRQPVSVADLDPKTEPGKPGEVVAKTPAINPESTYGFQDIRKGGETITPIDRPAGEAVLFKDIIEDIRAKNYPEGKGKAPPLNGEGKATATLDDKGVLKIEASGDVRDQELYKVDKRFKIDATFQTEALPQNDSELNKLRPGFKLPLDVKDIGNGGTLTTFDGKFDQRIGDNTMGTVTAKVDVPSKTATVGVGVENEVSGSKGKLEASFIQNGDITQLTKINVSGEHHTLKGGMIGATTVLDFAPKDGKLTGYEIGVKVRPDGSPVTFDAKYTEKLAENLKKFEIGAKSDSGTSLQFSTSTQTSGNELESKKVENQKLAFETKIYGTMEPIKKGEEHKEKNDVRNLPELGTVSVSAEKTTTTTKKPDPDATEEGKQKTEVNQEVKLAGSYKSTAGTELSGDVKITNGTVEEANAALKTPVFTTKQPEPGEKDENGELKKPFLEKQGDISVAGTYKNTPLEKSLEVGAGYESVGGTGISGKLKTNTETGDVISASGKLVSEIQDLKGEPDKDGKYKKIGTMTLEGSYDAPGKEATGKFQTEMDNKTGFMVSGTMDTESGKLKKIEGETSFLVEGGTKILVGGKANFIEKTIGGKLEITEPGEKGALSLSADFKNINGTYELQKFQGSVWGKDDKGNISKLEGAIDNTGEKKTASIGASYTDGTSKNAYGAYASFEDQKIKEAGLTFAGKVGDPKMAQSDLKVGLAATFKEGNFDGVKASLSLTPDNAPINKKYSNNDTYFVGADNVAKVMNIGKTTDPEARAKTTAESVAKLEPKDKALYEQATKAVEQLNESKKLNLPVPETAAALTLLAKEKKLPDIAQAIDGKWVSGGANLFIVSSSGERAEMNLHKAVNTNDQHSFDGIAKFNEQQKKAQEATTPANPEVGKDNQEIAPIKKQ